ncbi:MAG: YbaB/EbfC family nucleoid-associated protein [Bacilli bacterium]|jgi:hypothetical protein|nr:YbaB/EbfC family nucleoid-associated protein [Bacilli bacterium]
MNMQAMMQQAERMQKEILNAKKEVEEKVFNVEKDIVKVEMNGKKEILKVEINKENFEKEDIEIVEDLILLLINDCFKKIDMELEQKLSKFGPGIKGLI